MEKQAHNCLLFFSSYFLPCMHINPCAIYVYSLLLIPSFILVQFCKLH